TRFRVICGGGTWGWRFGPAVRQTPAHGPYLPGKRHSHSRRRPANSTPHVLGMKSFDRGRCEQPLGQHICSALYYLQVSTKTGQTTIDLPQQLERSNYRRSQKRANDEKIDEKAR
ncbi:MAG: hypothetical protein ACTSYE_00895, partial [Alphaproteobacteria bacterium]